MERGGAFIAFLLAATMSTGTLLNRDAGPAGAFTVLGMNPIGAVVTDFVVTFWLGKPAAAISIDNGLRMAWDGVLAIGVDAATDMGLDSLSAFGVETMPPNPPRPPVGAGAALGADATAYPPAGETGEATFCAMS